MSKSAKVLERYYKGVANHHRIAILKMLHDSKGMTLIEISEELHGNFKTISEHTKRLHQAGLIQKEYRSNFVLHTLSPYGEIMYKTFRLFDK